MSGTSHALTSVEAPIRPSHSSGGEITGRGCDHSPGRIRRIARDFYRYADKRWTRVDGRATRGVSRAHWAGNWVGLEMRICCGILMREVVWSDELG